MTLRKHNGSWTLVKSNGERLYIRGIVCFTLMVGAAGYLLAHVIIASLGR